MDDKKTLKVIIVKLSFLFGNTYNGTIIECYLRNPFCHQNKNMRLIQVSEMAASYELSLEHVIKFCLFNCFRYCDCAICCDSGFGDSFRFFFSSSSYAWVNVCIWMSCFVWSRLNYWRSVRVHKNWNLRVKLGLNAVHIAYRCTYNDKHIYKRIVPI